MRVRVLIASLAGFSLSATSWSLVKRRKFNDTMQLEH